MSVTGENQSVRRKRPSKWHFVYNKSRINRYRAHISAMTGRRLTSRAMANLLKHEFNVTNTGCFRRNLRYFGRTFLRKVYIDITKHTYIRSWAVTDILMGEKCGLLVLSRTVPVEGVLSVHCPSAPSSQKASQAIRARVCYVMCLEPQHYFHEIRARFSYLTSLCQSDVN